MNVLHPDSPGRRLWRPWKATSHIQLKLSMTHRIITKQSKTQIHVSHLQIQSHITPVIPHRYWGLWFKVLLGLIKVLPLFFFPLNQKTEPQLWLHSYLRARKGKASHSCSHWPVCPTPCLGYHACFRASTKEFFKTGFTCQGHKGSSKAIRFF